MFRMIVPVVAVGLLAAAALPAQAKEGNSHPAKKRTSSAFAQADANHDGVLSAAELKTARHGKNASAKFAKMDANGDGQVTLAEYKAYRSTHKLHHKKSATATKTLSTAKA
jgi:hypothetical protein